MGKKKCNVYQYDLSGNMIHVFDSPKDAEITLGLGRGSVSAVCNRDRGSANGMIFRYADDCDDIYDFIRKRGESIKEGIGKEKPVYQYDMHGNFIREWPSVAEAKRGIKCASSIAAVCSGAVRTAGGFVWSHTKLEKINVRPKKKRTGKISFEDYCIQNGLTDLLKEWDYSKNNTPPSKYSKGSNKKVAWVCNRGHHWEATISSRVAGRGCGKCKKQMSTSFPEQAIFYYVKKAYPYSINRYAGVAPNISEIDVFIPDIKVAIEYDGKRWHKDTKRDQDKDDACLVAGIQLIRVREFGCPEYSYTSTVIKTKADTANLTKTITDILAVLSNISGKPILVDVNIERDYVDIISEIRQLEAENSLQAFFPEIAAEWDETKNNGIKPSAVSAKSNNKYWWICPKCGFSYKMLVSNRTRLGEGCPRCGQEKSRQAKIKTINQYDLKGRFIASFSGAEEAGKVTNLKYYQNINAACKRKQKTAGGYIWRYSDDCDDICLMQEDS